MSLVKVNLWDDEENIRQIRSIYKAGNSDAKMESFIQLGKSTGLNPFNREIYLIPGGQILIGRDGYRKIAQSHADYDYHQYDCVHENDSFEVVNGEVRHSYNLKNRGKVLGAYCITKRKLSSKAVYVFVSMHEYSNGKNLWVTKPATMICKVAEGHCLRSCFSESFSGTYAEEEIDGYGIESHHTLGSNRLKAALNIENDASVTEDQLEQISRLIEEKSITQENIEKSLKFYKIESFTEFKKEKAQEFITLLERK